jgi:hypothetical protein
MTPGLHFTPETLAAAYTFLRTTKPFNRWKLPPAHDLKFKVTQSVTDAGYCAGREIGVSQKCSGHTHSMLATMAHEMIHLHLDARGVKAHHGPDFKRCAKLVSKHHGFDYARYF